MGNSSKRMLRSAGVVVATAALTATLAPPSTAGSGSWHILSPERVEDARLTETAFKEIDASITTVEFRKGGQGNIEVCGYDRTERISASRQSRWDTTTSRTGRTLILQYKKVRQGKSAFNRLKQTYADCTSDNFAKPERVTVNYQFLKKKKQARLVWALYKTDAKTDIQRAESLLVKRAGGALIITRAIVRDVTTTGPLKTKLNAKMTARQFKKYKGIAYF
jgi:hypothetical protein